MLVNHRIRSVRYQTHIDPVLYVKFSTVIGDMRMVSRATYRDGDYDSEQLDGFGWDADQECYCYDGFPRPDASDMGEAEMEYWNTY